MDLHAMAAMGLQLAANMMFKPPQAYVFENDDDSDDELELLLISNAVNKSAERRAKISHYVDNIVPQYSLDDFRKHFRLQRSTVQHLTELISQQLDDHSIHPGNRSTTGNINILLPIWTLSNQESFRGISDRFGVSAGHGYRIFHKFCKVLASKVGEVASWPHGRRMEENLVEFEGLREKSFPGVVGCVDGTYIPIRGLTAENESYCTRKKFRAVILQAVCDSKKRFIDIFSGWPGSSHDARVWRNSRVCEKLETEREVFLPNNTHLLGDSAYPLSSTLMVPCKDNGHLTQKQKYFNKVLSSSRVVIENSFGLLKSRFRRLRYLDVIRMDFASIIITAACVLHNICIDQDDILDDIEDDEDLDDETLENAARHTDGDAKRNRIADELFANK